LFDANQTTLIQYPGGLIGGYAIPGTVTNIADTAFDAALPGVSFITNLTSLTIPGSVTSIPANSFQYHAGLTNLTIANGVTGIGVCAFCDCPNLRSVTIAGSVTSIGLQAFCACSGLSNIYFGGNLPAVFSSAFNYCIGTAYYLPGTTGWSANFAGLPAMLWNPVIQTSDGSFGVRNNQFGFNITGTTNIPIVVEACTNLACPAWTPLTNLTLTNGCFYFSEPGQSGCVGRYYRIGSQ
jgi:hypothetical protein